MCVIKDAIILLSSLEFKLVDQKVSDYFGDYYCIFSNSKLNIRILSDRSMETFEISSTLDINYWVDLTLLKALIYNEHDLTVTMSIFQCLKFFEINILVIDNLLDSKNIRSTKSKIEELQFLRSQQLFS